MRKDPLSRPMPSALPDRSGSSSAAPMPVDTELQRRRTTVERKNGSVVSRQLCSPCLSRPLPVSNFFFVDAFGVSVVNALDDLALQPFFDVGADRSADVGHGR